MLIGLLKASEEKTAIINNKLRFVINIKMMKRIVIFCSNHLAIDIGCAPNNLMVLNSFSFDKILNVKAIINNGNM